MLVTDAVIELRYAKDWTKESTRWYSGRLKLFINWAAKQDVTALEDVTPMLVRRYMAYLQERPSGPANPSTRTRCMGTSALSGHSCSGRPTKS